MLKFSSEADKQSGTPADMVRCDWMQGCMLLNVQHESTGSMRRLPPSRRRRGVRTPLYWSWNRRFPWFFYSSSCLPLGGTPFLSAPSLPPRLLLLPPSSTRRSSSPVRLVECPPKPTTPTPIRQGPVFRNPSNKLPTCLPRQPTTQPSTFTPISEAELSVRWSRCSS